VQNKNHKLSSIEAIFSSISGAGPLVNFAILISYAYIYSGNAMFLSFIFAFILFILFFNSVYNFSTKKVGKGAYYLFFEENKYKKFYIYLYFIYSFSSIVSLITFISFILTGYIININYIFYFIIFITLSSFIFLLIKHNLKLSIKYTSIGAILEIIFIISITIYLGLNLNYNIKINIPSFNSIFIGGIFSVLIFAGLGSIISFGDMIDKPYKTVTKSLLISSLIEATVFIIASLILGLFLENMNYSLNVNSVIPVFMIIKNLGNYMTFIFLILLINSFINIIILYTVSLTRTYHIHIEEKIAFNRIVDYIFIVFLGISLFLLFLIGPLNTFLLTTSIASFNWIIFHDTINLELIKGYFKNKKNVIKNFVIPIAAILFSFIMIFFIINSNSFPFNISPIISFSVIIFLLIFEKNNHIRKVIK
jgi:amino acid transporter